MIATLLKFITLVPALISEIKSLIVWIMDQVDQARKRRASDAMAKAITLAQKEKDTSGMDREFDIGKK